MSSATNLVDDIIEDRYNPVNWNIYVCQASDGDNDIDDCKEVVESLKEDILPAVQYYAYIQVSNPVNILSRVYKHSLLNTFSNFAMAIIEEQADIFPVFRKLFEKDKK